MKYRIEGKFRVNAQFEISVAVGGVSYLVIYGEHVNGGFCAIPNHGITCEMGEADDIVYNMDSLVGRGLPEKAARAVAEAIRDAATLST